MLGGAVSIVAEVVAEVVAVAVAGSGVGVGVLGADGGVDHGVEAWLAHHLWASNRPHVAPCCLCCIVVGDAVTHCVHVAR